MGVFAGDVRVLSADGSGLVAGGVLADDGGALGEGGVLADAAGVLVDAAGVLIDVVGSSASIRTNAGFSLSRETVSLRPLMSSTKCLSHLDNTLYGPLYGCSKGLRTASVLTKTWDVLNRSL